MVMRKIIYGLYLVLFEIPNVLMPLAGAGITRFNVINHTITNYERNQIIAMVRQRDEKIGMHMMKEQLEEKEQYIK
jgi:hypothetical protein